MSIHASDCATHNGPALPVGPCDCQPVVTEVAMCGHVVRLGDLVRVRYSDGSGTLTGEVTELWDGRIKQARVNRGWCFHDRDVIERLEATK